MKNEKYLNTIFALIEHLTKAQLQNTSKHLVANYLDESNEHSYAGKARDVIKRYSQQEVPSLESIRAKGGPRNLNELDHLTLKMEYEASHIRR